MRILDRALEVVGGLFRRTQLAFGEGSTPGEGDLLQAFRGSHEFPPYVTRIIGEFKPHTITMQRRVMMRVSPDVAFMSALVRAPIVNMRWTVESKDAKIAACVDALLRPQYVPLAKSASLAMLLGFQVIQPVYEAKPFSFEVEDRKEGTSQTVTLPMAWTIKRHKGIDPRTLTLVADEKTDEFKGVKQDIEGGKEVEVGADRVILWSFSIEDEWGRLPGFGIYDKAYTPWYDQSGLIFLRNTYFESRAHPTPIGYATQGTVQDKNRQPIDAVDMMRSALGALRSRSFVVVPGTRDEKGNRHNTIEYLQDDKRGDMFQQAIDAEGVRILKCGLVPGESATSEPMGSRARAEVHENRLGEIQQTHVDEWRQVFQAFARRVAVYHFGEQAVEEAGLLVKAAGLSPGLSSLYREVLGKIMDAESTLADGSSVPLRKRIDAVGMCDDLELPMRPLEEAQEEWDQEVEDRQAKAAEIAEAGVKITDDMEREVEKDLSRIGATE
jgi:hypothetical protein